MVAGSGQEAPPPEALPVDTQLPALTEPGTEPGSMAWEPFGPVFSAIGPYAVTILPPEQKLFGVSANTILTLGIGVLVVGVVLSMVRK